jgi:hypothetical protein
VALWEVLSGGVSLLGGDVLGLGGDGSEGEEVSVSGEFHIVYLLIL